MGNWCCCCWNCGGDGSGVGIVGAVMWGSGEVGCWKGTGGSGG